MLCFYSPVVRPYGLCWGCYYAPGVRELYRCKSTQERIDSDTDLLLNEIDRLHRIDDDHLM